MNPNERLQPALQVAPVEAIAPLSVTARGSALTQWLSRPRTRDLGRALIYAAPALLIFFFFTYLPFFQSIFLSLHTTNPAGETVRFNGFGHYLRVLGLDERARTEYLQSIVISFQYALMVVPAGIVIAVSLAMLATLKVRFIEFFRTIFTSSIAISLASAGVIWSLIYNPSTGATTWLVNLLGLERPGLLNNDATALLAVAVMSVWSGIGFNFIITLAGVQAIPTDLYESASIDGAGGWTSFRFITLPLLSPTLLFLVVINTIGSLQAFTQFHLLLPGKKPSVFVYETYNVFWYDNNYGRASAMAILLFIMLLTLTVIQYRGLNRRVHYQ
jgi:ABC-type sugar transport system permease subunit